MLPKTKFLLQFRAIIGSPPQKPVCRICAKTYYKCECGPYRNQSHSVCQGMYQNVPCYTPVKSPTRTLVVQNFFLLQKYLQYSCISSSLTFISMFLPTSSKCISMFALIKSLSFSWFYLFVLGKHIRVFSEVKSIIIIIY